MKNALVKKIDREAVMRTMPKPVKNSLKTLVKIPVSKSFGPGVIYSKRITFDIPRNYDNLAQLYIKCTFECAAASLFETYFATKVFKEIIFKTKRGTVLQRIVPEYSQARVDEYYNTEIYTHLNAGIEPDSDFSVATTCVVPLFLFFSEDELSFLGTRNLEPLELECLVNESKDSMGLELDLTSAEYSLYALYHDVNGSNKISDESYTKKIVRPLSFSFNCFVEDNVVCPAGSTSAKLLLRCPHPSYVLHVSLLNSQTVRRQINTLKLTIGGNTLIEMDYRMNYQMYATTKSFVESGTFSLFFSKFKDRKVDSGLITFSKEMFPCYLEVTFDSIASEYTLNAIEEYRTMFSTDDKGYIGLSEDTIFSKEGFDQLNSSGSQFIATGT